MKKMNSAKEKKRKAYKRPEIVFRRSLEVMAGVCSLNQPGAKAQDVCDVGVS